MASKGHLLACFEKRLKHFDRPHRPLEAEDYKPKDSQCPHLLSDIPTKKGTLFPVLIIDLTIPFEKLSPVFLELTIDSSLIAFEILEFLHFLNPKLVKGPRQLLDNMKPSMTRLALGKSVKRAG
ncbi:hypothetical protein [Lactococcus ileimucosae]|uniref:hypothetical protein n=1 Tax=Lactococcus ileimucosae TaxID=2941329 RepID=UPI00204405A1|nr:hypothetical protein [Lactococcus ileimucosae]